MQTCAFNNCPDTSVGGRTVCQFHLDTYILGTGVWSWCQKRNCMNPVLGKGFCGEHGGATLRGICRVKGCKQPAVSPQIMGIGHACPGHYDKTGVCGYANCPEPVPHSEARCSAHGGKTYEDPECAGAEKGDPMEKRKTGYTCEEPGCREKAPGRSRFCRGHMSANDRGTKGVCGVRECPKPGHNFLCTDCCDQIPGGTRIEDWLAEGEPGPTRTDPKRCTWLQVPVGRRARILSVPGCPEETGRTILAVEPGDLKGTARSDRVVYNSPFTYEGTKKRDRWGGMSIEILCSAPGCTVATEDEHCPEHTLELRGPVVVQTEVPEPKPFTETTIPKGQRILLLRVPDVSGEFRTGVAVALDELKWTTYDPNNSRGHEFGYQGKVRRDPAGDCVYWGGMSLCLLCAAGDGCREVVLSLGRRCAAHTTAAKTCFSRIASGRRVRVLAADGDLAQAAPVGSVVTIPGEQVYAFPEGDWYTHPLWRSFRYQVALLCLGPHCDSEADGGPWCKEHAIPPSEKTPEPGQRFLFLGYGDCDTHWEVGKVGVVRKYNADGGLDFTLEDGGYKDHWFGAKIAFLCQTPGCDARTENRYCGEHKCAVSGCPAVQADDTYTSYCSDHTSYNNKNGVRCRAPGCMKLAAGIVSDLFVGTCADHGGQDYPEDRVYKIPQQHPGHIPAGRRVLILESDERPDLAGNVVALQYGFLKCQDSLCKCRGSHYGDGLVTDDGRELYNTVSRLALLCREEGCDTVVDSDWCGAHQPTTGG